MIELKGIIKNYRTGDHELRAVDSIDMTVQKGEFILIVGRSGSGKSTLLGIMGGLIRPTEGRAALNDQDLWEMSDPELARTRGERIGFVFQFSGLLNTLTALENVMLPSMFASRKEDAEARAKTLLNRLGLAEKIGSYPNQLSGGEMKRVAIARALINDPDVLLADEPTGDLDASTELEIMELLREINRGGKTIVMVTHNPELSPYATSLYHMDKGHIELHSKCGAGM